MNNLKRVLSLALSGIMLVGMMAMGASAADFTDADEITHRDAVDILVALDVINGQDDGSFNPQGDVTRAQMAKMIAVAMKGGNDVSTGVKSTASFTDIKGHWAESYIEYCYDLGIINGRGEGVFAPDDKVTGVEAAKMVLTALGYDSEAFKLTGAQWATRTDELARIAKPSLYEALGNDVVLNAPANRDTAAQMIWNGLQNRTKKYQPSTNTSNGEVTWQYIDSDTMLKVRYNADIYTGKFDANSNTNTGLEKGQILVSRVGGTNTVTNTAANSQGTARFPANINIDYIGEEVQVIYKNGARSSQTGPDKNDTIYGVFVTGTTNVVRTTRDKLAGVKTNRAVLKVDGTEYEIHQTVDQNGNVTGNDADVFYNYVVGTDLAGNGMNYTNGYDTGNGDTSSFAKLLEHANGDAVKIILDDAGRIDTIYVTEAKLAVVTNVNGDKVTINNSVGTIKKSVNDIYEDVKKDDVVVVSTLYNNDATHDDAYTIVKKAEVVSGTLSAYKDKKDAQGNLTDCESITVDGTVYKIYHTNGAAATSVLALNNPGLGSKAITTLDSTVLDAEVEAYLVNGFVAAAKKTSAAASNYSVVMEIRKSTQSSSVFSNFQLYVMDGNGVKTIINVNDEVEDKTINTPVAPSTDKIIDLSKLGQSGNGQSYTANKPEEVFEVGDIITYSLDKDGNADVVIEDRPTNTTGYNKSTKEVGGVVTANDAVIFVLTKGTYAMNQAGDQQTGAGMTIKAYKATDLGDVGSGTLPVTVATASGRAAAAFIALGAEPNGSTSNEVYGVVASVGSTVKDGTQYVISVNGESQTVTLKSNSTPLTKGQVVRFEPTSDNIYANASKFALPAGKAFSAYVDEYDADRNIITFYFGSGKIVPNDYDANGNVTSYKVANNATDTTYAVKSDVKIYAVDVDSATTSTGSAASVSGFNTNTGKRNVILVTDQDANGNYEVSTIIIETSGQKDVDVKTPGVAK